MELRDGQGRAGGQGVCARGQNHRARRRVRGRCRQCRRALRVNEDHYTLARLLAAHPELKGAVVPKEAHGTFRGYVFFGCRCDRCRKANSDISRARRERRRAAKVPEHLHGTYTGYVNWSCRCDRCKEANNVYLRNWRAINNARTAAESV